MPQRTNEFQELVSLIQHALAPKGAKITDSAMVEAGGLDTLREVDILIEGQFGPYQIKVAVEAKDEARKFGLPAFDALVAKYRGECRVLVDKFLIVARRGFTKGVLEKAKKLDVELLTLDEAKTKDWTTVGPPKLHFSVPPHICRLEFTPSIETDEPKKLWNEGQMFCPHGHDVGTPMQRAVHLVFHRFFASNPEYVRDLERQIRESPGGQGMLRATYEHEGFTIRFEGREHRIMKMIVHVHAVSGQGEMRCREYEMQSTKGAARLVRHLQGVAGGKKLDFLLPDGIQSPQLALRISPAEKLTPTEKRKQRKQRSKAAKKKATQKRKKKGARKRGKGSK